MFFNHKTLAPLSKTTPEHYLNMIDLIGAGAFNFQHSEPLGEQDLVIHIRSGDIFKNNVHLGYGQPPFSFYAKIIELQSWHSISLVFEDKSNPIIDPLIDFCRRRCSQVQEISGDLKSDIEYLLRARKLVVSNGTFCPAIALISKSLNTVYSFENEFSIKYNPNISQIVRVVDRQGVYKSEILSSNWQNTELQRKLMLEYPTNVLDFDSDNDQQIKPTKKTNIGSINIDQNANTNLALNKPTVQSSIYGAEKHGYDPHGACNGKKTRAFGFCTMKEDRPWWQIDLQRNYEIYEIKIYNRMDSCQERASTLNVLLSQDALNWELCYSNPQDNLFGGIDGKPLIVNGQNRLARYIRLQLRDNEYFHLDEVEIYGIPFSAKGSNFKFNQDETTLSANFYGDLLDNLELEKQFAIQTGLSFSSMKSLVCNPKSKLSKKTI
ncbi:discoidin domain-containing protein [Okeania sp. KiyG1]|uniref:galactose-binding domain-containing protein n=1 Tax=Okeania sp. KiyG1 TaxID=2720165 RepID=UPI0019219CB5|nr:discoidin domain-containing protein [Okeania sp. KiyG1]GGA56346.1 hypothetical protein CYANOKiyG1_77180 [Okeania sp. KiyG1]